VILIFLNYLTDFKVKGFYRVWLLLTNYDLRLS